MIRRLERVGDLWYGMNARAYKISALMRRLDKI